MPTINMLPSSNKLLPPYGVYVSRTCIKDKQLPSVTNIGFKPTVGEEKSVGVETYIFDFDGNVYGDVLEVELIHYVRPELKFDTIDELVSQMQEDIRFAKEYHL